LEKKSTQGAQEFGRTGQTGVGLGVGEGLGGAVRGGDWHREARKRDGGGNRPWWKGRLAAARKVRSEKRADGNQEGGKLGRRETEWKGDQGR